jgi:hypothetical protein
MRWLRIHRTLAMQSPIALLVLGSFVLSACNVSAGEGDRASRERDELARFPLGEIVEDGEDPAHDMRPFPPSLHLLATALGRGVCVSLEVARSDGAHDAPRWGVWTYEYVRADSKLSSTGEPMVMFGPVDKTSTGVEAQGEYASDVPVGLWRFWFPNGQPRAEGSFNEGRLSGEWKFWLPDGQPDTQRSGVYRGGELAGAAGR